MRNAKTLFAHLLRCSDPVERRRRPGHTRRIANADRRNALGRSRTVARYLGARLCAHYIWPVWTYRQDQYLRECGLERPKLDARLTDGSR